jgi:hypothetical protein
VKTNGIEDPDTNPHNYSHLILTKVPKMCAEEKTAFSTNGAEKTGFPPAEDESPVSHLVLPPIQNELNILM